MKPIIKNALLVIILIMIFDFSIGMFSNKMLDNAKWRNYGKEKYCIEMDTSDIKIFGSSRAEVHYVPSILEKSLNYSVFNFGNSGKGLAYSLGMFSASLKHHVPKVVILDLLVSDVSGSSDDDSFGIVGTMNHFKPYYYRNRDIRDYMDEYITFKDKLLLRINSYRFNSELLNLFGSNYLYSNEIVNKGYIPNNKSKIKITEGEAVEYQYNESKIKLLIEFINKATDNDIKLIIVYSPSMSRISQSVNKEILDICNVYNLPFINFSRNIEDIKQYEFADHTHLNKVGAERFSTVLSDSLQIILKK